MLIDSYITNLVIACCWRAAQSDVIPLPPMQHSHCHSMSLRPVSSEPSTCFCTRVTLFSLCVCACMMDCTYHSTSHFRDEGTSSHCYLWPGRPHRKTQSQWQSALLSGVRGNCSCSLYMTFKWRNTHLFLLFVGSNACTTLLK